MLADCNDAFIFNWMGQHERSGWGYRPDTSPYNEAGLTYGVPATPSAAFRLFSSRKLER